MYPILKPILNRGGAGRSMTRAESVEALNPLIGRHAELLLAYDVALRTLADREIAGTINRAMNAARTELAKLKETVFSLGGTPPNSTDLVPAVRLGDDDAAILHALDDAERAYRDALSDTLGLAHHQIRTAAILENNLKGSDIRLGVLHPMVTRMRRPGSRPARPVPTDDVTGNPVDLEQGERHATFLERGNIQNTSD